MRSDIASVASTQRLTMTERFYPTAARKQAISWMLIVAFLSLTLFPHHYHLHHVTDSTASESGLQEHAMDVHIYTDIEDINRHADSYIIKSGVDVSFKSQGLQLPWVVVILVVFSLLLSLFLQESKRYPGPGILQPRRFNRHTTPPLRAPPRV